MNAKNLIMLGGAAVLGYYLLKKFGSSTGDYQGSGIDVKGIPDTKRGPSDIGGGAVGDNPTSRTTAYLLNQIPNAYVNGMGNLVIVDKTNVSDKGVGGLLETAAILEARGQPYDRISNPYNQEHAVGIQLGTVWTDSTGASHTVGGAGATGISYSPSGKVGRMYA